jgi:hypothetical protein
MKIVRLVLLLSLVGVSAACSADSVTGSATSAPTTSPSLDSTTPPDSTARDGGGSFGSGT